MPDITMCADEKCPIKNECYRYRAYPSQYRQSYFADIVRTDEGCKYKMTLDGWDDKYLTPIKPELERGGV